MEPTSLRRNFFRELAVPSLAFLVEDSDGRRGRWREYRLFSQGRALRMRVKFFDRYRANGLRFLTSAKSASFCLSAGGRENDGCIQTFAGAVAVAEYQLEEHDIRAPVSLVEVVRTVDGDSRLPARPPFQRRIAFDRGVASDIQAFGYENADTARAASELWCVVRQDLSWEESGAPFLVLHWKHSAASIELLDVIPTGGTSIIAGAKGK